jgi:protease-4
VSDAASRGTGYAGTTARSHPERSMNQPVPPLPPARRNPVASFFIGLWDVMNFTRRLILNLVFFGLLFLLLVMFVIAPAWAPVPASRCRTAPRW